MNKPFERIILSAFILVLSLLASGSSVATSPALAEDNRCREGTTAIYDGGGELISCEELIGNPESCPEGTEPGYLATGDLVGCFEHEMTTAVEEVCNPAAGDADEDGLGDVCDPCPNDTDCDKDRFSDSGERYVETNPLLACGQDAWPPDINSDGVVNVLDILRFPPVLLSALGQPNYDRRFDLNADGKVNVLDILVGAPFLMRRCEEISNGEVSGSSFWAWDRLRIPIVESYVQQRSTSRWCIPVLGCRVKYWLFLYQYFYWTPAFPVIGLGHYDIYWGAYYPYWVGDDLGEDAWFEGQWIHYQDHWRSTATMNLWVFPELTCCPFPVSTWIDARYGYFQVGDSGF